MDPLSLSPVPGVINQKTPTTILFTPNLEFHSFGFSARDFFHDLDPDEAKRWLYFEKFKMHLHHTQVSGEHYARRELHSCQRAVLLRHHERE